MNNEAELIDVAQENRTESSMSEAEAARYFRNALIGLMVGIPAIFPFMIASCTCHSTYDILAIDWFIVLFSAFMWGFYSLVKLKGYIWYPTLLGFWHLPGLLILLLLPTRNRPASSKVRTLWIICVAWFLLLYGSAGLVKYLPSWLFYPACPI